MSLYALEAIDDALAATGRYRPSEAGEWAWVVIVAGAVASPGFGLPTGGNSSGGMPAESRAAVARELPAALPDLLLVGLAIVATLWLCVTFLGAFLEFPFLRWLRDGDLALREEVRANWRRAVGLAVFRVLLRLASVVVLVWVTVGIAGRGPDPWTYLVVLVEYWVLFAGLGLLTGVVSAYTTSFVVPAMWLEDRGVVDAWQRVWPTMRAEPKQFLAFAVAVAILATLGGILVAVAAVAVAVPALLAGLATATVVGNVAGAAVGATLGLLLGAVVVGMVYAFLQVFLRYYALFVLGDAEPALDVIPERRRVVRAADDGGDDRGGDGGEPARSDGDGEPDDSDETGDGDGGWRADHDKRGGDGGEPDRSDGDGGGNGDTDRDGRRGADGRGDHDDDEDGGGGIVQAP